MYIIQTQTFLMLLSKTRDGSILLKSFQLSFTLGLQSMTWRIQHKKPLHLFKKSPYSFKIPFVVIMHFGGSAC